MVKIISHRGNLRGPSDPMQNTYIAFDDCFSYGFDVEADVRWCGDGVENDFREGFYLGHDYPQAFLEEKWAAINDHRIIYHAKDLLTASVIHHHTFKHWFYHEIDPVTLTSVGYIWAHPSILLTMYDHHLQNDEFVFSDTIAVLPEKLLSIKRYDIGEERAFLNKFYGICTDMPLRYKEILI